MNIEKFKIVDYESRYAKDVDDMEINQWGEWGEESIDDFVNENEIIRVALYDNDFVGVSYGNFEIDHFWIDVICIVPKYQKQGFGTLMLDDIINVAKSKFNINLIRTESVYVNEKSNSKKMLEYRGFKTYKKQEKGYWGKMWPNVFCTECNHNPCECITLFYELKL